MIHCGSPRSPRAQKPAFMQFTCNMCCCEIAECTIHFRLGQCLCRATGDLHARTDHISSRGVTTLALTLYELALVCLVYQQIQSPLSIISIVAEPVTPGLSNGRCSVITPQSQVIMTWQYLGGPLYPATPSSTAPRGHLTPGLPRFGKPVVNQRQWDGQGVLISCVATLPSPEWIKCFSGRQLGVTGCSAAADSTVSPGVAEGAARLCL